MPLTCLIAAHDPWFLQLLRIYSEESGFRVVQVHEGQDVLPMVHQEHPAAVIMQADLPGRIKGREVLHSLKSDTQAHHIPVVVVSWQGNPDDESGSSLLDEAEGSLREPVTFENFQDVLRKVGVCAPSGASAPSSAAAPDCGSQQDGPALKPTTNETHS
jgi:DNA-binding response OmpR family regulator